MDSQGGVEMLLVPSCYRNWNKLWPDGPLGSYADFTFYAMYIKRYNSPVTVYIYTR